MGTNDTYVENTTEIDVVLFEGQLCKPNQEAICDNAASSQFTEDTLGNESECFVSGVLNSSTVLPVKSHTPVISKMNIKEEPVEVIIWLSSPALRQEVNSFEVKVEILDDDFCQSSSTVFEVQYDNMGIKEEAVKNIHYNSASVDSEKKNSVGFLNTGKEDGLRFQPSDFGMEKNIEVQEQFIKNPSPTFTAQNESSAKPLGGKCGLKKRRDLNLEDTTPPVETLHLRKNEAGKFECTQCNRQTASKRFMERHIKMHIKANLKCRSCPYTTRHEYNLVCHMKKHHIPPIRCRLCSFRTTDRSCFKVHMTKHYNHPFKCKKCNYTTLLKKDYNAHRSKCSEDFLKCDECGHRAMSARTLKKHKKIHSRKKLKCSVCDFETKRTDSFVRHVMKHT